MAKKPEEPFIGLSVDQQKAVKDQLYKISQIAAEIDKAEQCGIPCQEYREELRKQQERLEKLHKHYGSK